MKKAGWISFICYLLYTLGGGGMALYHYMTLETNDNLGLEGLGIAIVMVLEIVLAGVGFLGIIIKGLHLKTEWAFFGVLCILFDIACIAFLVVSVINEGGASADILALLPLAIPSAVAFVANIVSMKK